jgi:hypothetical protein
LHFSPVSAQLRRRGARHEKYEGNRRVYIVRGFTSQLCVVGLSSTLLGLCDARSAESHVSPPIACRQQGVLAWLPVAPEASGAALSRAFPGVVWTHNDSGEPAIFAIDSTGALLGALRVRGARAVDWEAVAVGPCAGASCLYIGDIGDNDAKRRDIVVYRVREPMPKDRQTNDAEAFHATYPDGPHDAEALFVTADGGVYVVTKGETGAVAMYRFPQPLRPDARVRLERVATLIADKVKRHERVTDASASPDGEWVVLRTAASLSFYPTKSLTSGSPGQPRVADIRAVGETQGEGVALGANGRVFLVGEGGLRRKRPGTFARMTCTLTG